MATRLPIQPPPDREFSHVIYTGVSRGGNFRADPFYISIWGRIYPSAPAVNSGRGFRPAFTAFDALATNGIPAAPAAPANPAATAVPNRSVAVDSYRVLCGGSWYFDAPLARAGVRVDFTPGSRFVGFGFRPAFTAFDVMSLQGGAPARVPTMPAAPTAQVAPAAPRVPAVPVVTVPNGNVSVSANRMRSGGSWGSGASDARAEYREDVYPNIPYTRIGFRPVFTAFDQMGIQGVTPAAPAAPTVSVVTVPNRNVSVDSPRVVRSGSWINGASGVRAGYRYARPPGYHYGSLGFRPAFTAFDVMEITQGRPVPAPVVVLPITATTPRSPPPPPPAPPPPKPTVLPERASNLFEDYLRRKFSPAFELMYRRDPFTPMNVSDDARRAFIYGTTPNALAPEMTITRGQVVDYYGSIFIPLPDEKNYYYLFDSIQTSDYSDHLGIVPFGWMLSSIPIIKSSYPDTKDHTYQGKQYWRMHSLGSRNTVFSGAGTPVYMGGAIGLAFWKKVEGIYSDAGRSPAATKFWERAIGTGLAFRETPSSGGYYDMMAAETALSAVLTVRGPYDLHGPYLGMYRQFEQSDRSVFRSAQYKKKFKVTATSKNVTLARGELLARAMFFMTNTNIYTVRSMIEATKNADALSLFNARPDIRAVEAAAAAGTPGLAGLGNMLRARRPMPPIPTHLAGIIGEMDNPH
jgi:hypothetical protein